MPFHGQKSPTVKKEMCSVIHLEITQSPKAGGWHMEELYLCLADAVTLILSSPAVFRCVWFVPLFRTGQFWLPVPSVETDSFRHYCKCNLSLWAKPCDKGHKPKHTQLFWMEVAIYMQELLRLWEISCASYFLFREAILLVSWYSTVITELQFLKERRMEGWEKWIVSLIPPGAAQYFSFVKVRVLSACRDALLSKFWNLWWDV